MLKEKAIEAAERIFRKYGGTLRTGAATREGIHPRTLYAMRDAGVLETLSRGLYRLADLSPLGNPDLVSVALRVPNCVICLVSALAFHEVTTQVPHAVYFAVSRRKWRPALNHPPVRIFWFDGLAFTEGIETHNIDSVPVRVYSPEKTLADCFKHRNKIGLDVALEALKLYRRRKPLRVDELVRYAKICRVEKIMRPYLEAIL
ncbi:MAG: type IV toxin-antitoxin system AbiEi family antitoxin domain-containing protein [Candidatus Eisenbacteria bacterium]